jgi:hypothetical protein
MPSNRIELARLDDFVDGGIHSSRYEVVGQVRRQDGRVHRDMGLGPTIPVPNGDGAIPVSVLACDKQAFSSRVRARDVAAA